MTQPNDDVPFENRGFVDNMTARSIIYTAPIEIEAAKNYLENITATEPDMMRLVDRACRSLLGTVTNGLDVTLSDAEIKQLEDLMGLVFSLGFRTGGENMRKFYSDALDGLIEPPHGYKNEDFN